MIAPSPDLSSLDPAVAQDRNALVTVTNRGEFWKPCPGTTAGYLCCGYQILTPLTGCGMYCRYCILQVYFEHACQVAFDNFDDLEREVKSKLAGREGVVRFGTGEFGDSLYLEDSLGFSRRIARLLEPYPQAIIEFKTKSTNISSLQEIRDPSKVIIGFSMNTEQMIAECEQGTAPLEDRLAAAGRCVEMGFWVAFHFDPMIWYPAWENEYRDVVKRIFNALPDPARIAWWSMGGFRTMPELKKRLSDRHHHLPLFAGEMVLGEDRKLRYFRPIRVAFYQAMRGQIDHYYPRTTLYLCMESPEVWEESGMIKRIPEGLPRYLDSRANEMLRRADDQDR